MSNEIVVLGVLGLIIAILGVCFIEGFKYSLVYMLGWLIWGYATFIWWWIPLCEKWFK